MSEYISIKDFAERAGVSTQAVYQRAEKDLKAFIQVEKGKKVINTAALRLFENKQNSKVDCKVEESSLQAVLLETIGVLRAQLEEKDKQLAMAAEEKMQLLERLKDAQQSEQQAHALHAGTMQQAIEARPAGATYEAEPERRKKPWQIWKK